MSNISQALCTAAADNDPYLRCSGRALKKAYEFTALGESLFLGSEATVSWFFLLVAAAIKRAEGEG